MTAAPFRLQPAGGPSQDPDALEKRPAIRERNLLTYRAILRIFPAHKSRFASVENRAFRSRLQTVPLTAAGRS